MHGPEVETEIVTVGIAIESGVVEARLALSVACAGHMPWFVAADVLYKAQARWCPLCFPVPRQDRDIILAVVCLGAVEHGRCARRTPLSVADGYTHRSMGVRGPVSNPLGKVKRCRSSSVLQALRPIEASVGWNVDWILSLEHAHSP